jgi:hypothetical protein
MTPCSLGVKQEEFVDTKVISTITHLPVTAGILINYN